MIRTQNKPLMSKTLPSGRVDVGIDFKFRLR